MNTLNDIDAVVAPADATSFTLNWFPAPTLEARGYGGKGYAVVGPAAYELAPEIVSVTLVGEPLL